MYSLDRYSKQGFEWESSDEYRCWQERSFKKKGLKILEQEKSQKVSLEKWEELGPRVQEPALSKARTLSLS